MTGTAQLKQLRDKSESKVKSQKSTVRSQEKKLFMTLDSSLMTRLEYLFSQHLLYIFRLESVIYSGGV
jgi:hypothetical protein